MHVLQPAAEGQVYVQTHCIAFSQKGDLMFRGGAAAIQVGLRIALARECARLMQHLQC